MLRGSYRKWIGRSVNDAHDQNDLVFTGLEKNELDVAAPGDGFEAVDDWKINQVGNDTAITFSGFNLVAFINIQTATLQSDGTFVFA